MTYCWWQEWRSRRDFCYGCQRESVRRVGVGRSAVDHRMLHPLFSPPPPHRNCCWESPFSGWHGERWEDYFNGLTKEWRYDSVCVVMRWVLASSQIFNDNLYSISAQREWLCVWLYLHSDGTFFGHRLVHPNEGHIVIKVIHGALEWKREEKTGTRKHEKIEGQRERRGVVKFVQIKQSSQTEKMIAESLFRTSGYWYTVISAAMRALQLKQQCPHVATGWYCEVTSRPGATPGQQQSCLRWRGEGYSTWMSWMDMTEQGKVMSELTLTTTVSTPSGKTYLKYWEKGKETEEDNERHCGWSTLSGMQYTVTVAEQVPVFLHYLTQEDVIWRMWNQQTQWNKSW